MGSNEVLIQYPAGAGPEMVAAANAAATAMRDMLVGNGIEVVVKEAAAHRWQAGLVDGWERLVDEIELSDGSGNDIFCLEAGDWIWCDDEGRVRRAYGYSGSSFMRVHTFTETGACLIGIEARDVLDAAALEDPNGIYPAVRAVAMDTPISREEAAVKWPGRGWWTRG